ncbi:hypothetical protein [Nonomuraea sp. NPDC049684]|uniref:hypothetical protein n=1 Tax=Nonomuraea sp. NPDC049684 TaxID=3364356 RepID=UPI0037A76605
MTDVREVITHAYHDEWARVITFLTRHFGDLDIAEEAAAEAFAAAGERWPAVAYCPLFLSERRPSRHAAPPPTSARTPAAPASATTAPASRWRSTPGSTCTGCATAP